MRKEIVCLFAQRITSSVGKHNEGDRSVARQSVTNTIRSHGHFMVWTQFWWTAAVWTIGPNHNKYRKVSKSKSKTTNGMQNVRKLFSILRSFCRDLVKIRDRHSDVVQTMAQGVIEMKEQRGESIEPSIELSMQYFLDRLYMSRTSTRMLIDQHSKWIRNRQL